MSIWHRSFQLEELQQLNRKTAGEHLHIQYTEIGANYLEATMPVDDSTRQPYGILHGGAAALLAETLGSVASSMVIDHEQFYTVGIELNINHLRQVREGQVTGKATPIHTGRSVHVWQIDIRDEKERHISSAKLTCMILKRG